MTDKEITLKKRQYMRIYKEMNSLLRKYNPCGIHLNEEGAKLCRDSTPRYPRANSLCCGSCNHHSNDKGCTVEALGCKMFLCGAAIEYLKKTLSKKDYIIFFGTRDYLQNKIYMYHLPYNMFTDMETAFKTK